MTRLLHPWRTLRAYTTASARSTRGDTGVARGDVGRAHVDQKQAVCALSVAVDAVRSLFPDKWLGVNILGYVDGQVTAAVDAWDRAVQP